MPHTYQTFQNGSVAGEEKVGSTVTVKLHLRAKWSNVPKTRTDTGDSLPNDTRVRIGESTGTSSSKGAADSSRVDVTVAKGGGGTLDEGRA